jgi:hypothetical protein
MCRFLQLNLPYGGNYARPTCADTWWRKVTSIRLQAAAADQARSSGSVFWSSSPALLQNDVDQLAH